KNKITINRDGTMAFQINPHFIVSDKTGTITTNKIDIMAIYTNHDHINKKREEKNRDEIINKKIEEMTNEEDDEKNGEMESLFDTIGASGKKMDKKIDKNKENIEKK